MGSSDTGGGVVDCSVGSIVWVRRRNGSWWPGKILGPEELSSSHITSPRSGTPVKLLGREDASVDWYNLEKSKRVKAFRCGEFDDCIERAEAAQGMPPKKREKYARREDAIMHALELERQLVEKKHGNSDYASWAGSKVSPDGATSSNYIGNGVGNKGGHLSNPGSENLGSSVCEKNEADVPLHKEKLRDGNQFHVEDDGAGLPPRMRGLQDVGLRAAASIGEELSRVAPRAKRSKYSHVQYGSSGHTDDNHIQSPIDVHVSKVEETVYPGDLGEDQLSGSTEDTETDCSGTDSLGSDSDDDLTQLSDGSASIELHPKYPGRIDVHEDHGSISSTDDVDGNLDTNGPAHRLLHDHVSSGSEVSKRRFAGKRKKQNSWKKALDVSSETPRRYLNMGNSSGRSDTKVDSTDKISHISKYSSKGTPSPYVITDFESQLWNNHSATRAYDGSQEYFSSFGGKHSVGGRFMLVDVDLQVNGNSYRRNVPIISLTSKLNGHAIIGHPVQVETLENGSVPNYLSTTGYSSSEPLDSPTLTSVWRTGRRTANFRVPRPFLSPRLNGQSHESVPPMNHDAQRPFPSDPGNIHQKPSVSQNSYTQSLLDRKVLVMPPKLSAATNLKIRSLSSIPAEDRHRNENGLIKTGNLPTAVSCIPVNLVFSRLHEGLAD